MVKDVLIHGEDAKTTLTLHGLIDLYVDHKKAIANLAPESVKKYGYLKNKIDDIMITRIRKPWIFQFHAKLRQSGLSHNTAVKSMRLLKAVLNFASHNDFIGKNPMDGYRMTLEKKEIIYLNEVFVKNI
ncbi:MAG: hypothetical protein HKN40_00385 [Winogradskyella sp.]|uniref:phage integrase SAM-like domain-containing protein n=1 Tax=Winogradskyella sp. TaxID=1883156 RepID=UPI001808694A|nr:hypothetical protein [Winogradskyella sp.]